jgi:hypothetical protein
MWIQAMKRRIYWHRKIDIGGRSKADELTVDRRRWNC